MEVWPKLCSNDLGLVGLSNGLNSDKKSVLAFPI